MAKNTSQTKKVNLCVLTLHEGSPSLFAGVLSDTGAATIATAITISQSPMLSLIKIKAENETNGTTAALKSIFAALKDSELEGISLVDFAIDDEAFAVFAESLKASKSITSLTINKLAISETSVSLLLDVIATSSLTSVCLQNIAVSQQQLSVLAKAATDNTLLKTIMLRDNKLNDELVRGFLDACASSALEAISFADNEVSDATANAVIEFAKKSQTLQRVSLANTSITGETLKAFGKELKEGVCFKELDLTRCKASSADLVAFGETLKGNGDITTLALNGIEGDDKDWCLLIDSLRNCHALKRLSLHSCKLGEKAAISLSSLLATGYLTDLEISNNESIGNDNFDKIFKSVPLCDTLVALRANNCGISTALLSVISLLESESGLETLELALNAFPDNLLKDLADALKVNSSLKHFDFSWSLSNADYEVPLLYAIEDNHTLLSVKGFRGAQFKGVDNADFARQICLRNGSSSNIILPPKPTPRTPLAPTKVPLFEPEVPKEKVRTQAELKKLWKTFDYNGNGILSLAEIDRAIQIEMPKYFKSKPVLIRAYKAADISGDGYIQYKEFETLIRLIEEYEILWQKFQQIDKDGDRRISFDEFKKGFDLLDFEKDSDIAEVFQEMDSNRGGKVLFDEFVMVMAKRKVTAKDKTKKAKKMGLAPSKNAEEEENEEQEEENAEDAENVEEQEKFLMKKRLKTIFDSIDEDKSGMISPEEAKEGISRLLPKYESERTSPLLSLALRIGDTSGDGYIDFDEFVSFLQTIKMFDKVSKKFPKEIEEEKKMNSFSFEEFKEELERFNHKRFEVTDEEYKEVYDLFDVSQSNLITFTELQMGIAVLAQRMKEKKIEEKKQERLSQTQTKRMGLTATTTTTTSTKTAKASKTTSPTCPAAPKKEPISDAKLKEMWNVFDYNGNGILSLAEIDKAVRDVMPQYFNSKPVLMRAYKTADISGDGYIQYKEFKFLIRLIEQYELLWKTFQSMDTDGDRRISFSEFKKGYKKLNLPTSEVMSDKALREEFNSFDTNKGGWILFDEFVMEMSKRVVKAKESCELKILLKEITSAGGAVATSSTAATTYTSSSKTTKTTTTKKMGLTTTASKSLPAEKKSEIPPATKYTEARLKELWTVFDYNGNGILSLAEIDRACMLVLPQFYKSKPVLMRAYKAADTSGDGYIQYKEFKTLILLLEQFQKLYDIFKQIDKDGDSRIDFTEFERGYSHLNLPKGKTSTELRSVFKKMDTNNGGYVLFDEFVVYCAKELSDCLQLDLPCEAVIKPIPASGVDKKKTTTTTTKKTALTETKPVKERLPLFAPAQPKPEPYTKQQLKELWDVFDYNGNGILSLAEIDRAVQLTMPKYFKSKPVLIRAYKAADVSGDGYIQYNEFETLIRLIEEYEILWQKFQQIDTDSDRRISFDEFKAGYVYIGDSDASEEEMAGVFEAMDTNNGGFVLFDEFVMVMAKNAIEKGLVPDEFKKTATDTKPEEEENLFMARIQEIWNTLDTKKGGKISMTNMERATKMYSPNNEKDNLLLANALTFAKLTNLASSSSVYTLNDKKVLNIEFGPFERCLRFYQVFEVLAKKYKKGTAKATFTKDEFKKLWSDNKIASVEEDFKICAKLKTTTTLEKALFQLTVRLCPPPAAPKQDVQKPNKMGLTATTTTTTAKKVYEPAPPAETKRTKEELKKLWNIFDYNGNGILSLAEIDRAIQLTMPQYFKSKPVLIRAYKAADVSGDGYIQYKEFETLIKLIEEYEVLWQKFQSIDKDGDRRISFDEFKKGYTSLGLAQMNDTKLKNIFNEMDSNRGGVVLFDEFVMYMSKQVVKKEAAEAKEKKLALAATAPKETTTTTTTTTKKVTAPNKTANHELSTQRLRELWQIFDYNGNGILSLAEIDRAVQLTMPQYFKSKPVLIRAYKAADTSGDGYIQYKEFKMLIRLIEEYQIYWEIFQDIDQDGDRRLTLDEFKKGAEKVRKALPPGVAFGDDTVEQRFKKIDTNNGGVILFDEFVFYIAKLAYQAKENEKTK